MRWKSLLTVKPERVMSCVNGGAFVSPSGVRGIWLRHNLANFKDRLNALEKKVAEENHILTEAQVAAMEKKKDDDVACGEIGTAHPGYLGSQDTYYVGTFKRIGWVYQQTFVDTYSKVAHAKLYTTKTPITAADLLNDRVLPFMNSTTCRCCGYSPTEALSIVAKQSNTTISCTWLSMI